MCKKNDRYFYTFCQNIEQCLEMHKKYCNYKKLVQKYISIATLQKKAVLKSNLNGRFFYTIKEV